MGILRILWIGRRGYTSAINDYIHLLFLISKAHIIYHIIQFYQQHQATWHSSRSNRFGKTKGKAFPRWLHRRLQAQLPSTAKSYFDPVVQSWIYTLTEVPLINSGELDSGCLIYSLPNKVIRIDVFNKLPETRQRLITAQHYIFLSPKQNNEEQYIMWSFSSWLLWN